MQMLRKTLSLFVFSIFVVLGLQAQNLYTQDFKTIDSLAGRGLPESALEKAEALLPKIRKDKNNKQQTALLIKSFITFNRFKAQLEEEGLVNAIYRFQEETEKADGLTQAVMQSMLAEMYHQYLNNHLYKFQDRTATTEYKAEDIRTWSIRKITDKVFELYEASLDHPELKTAKIKDHEPLLNSKSYDVDIQPTLYDLLINRALNFFSAESSYLTQPAYKFYIEDLKTLADAETFAKTKFVAKDSISKKFKTLLMYQELIQYHLKDQQKDALIHADLRRLKWVYNNCIIGDKDERYLNQLNALAKKHAQHEMAAEALYEVANWHAGQGNKYKPSPEQTYRWELKTAKKLVEEIIQKYPKSNGAKYAESLVSTILGKNLYFEMEEISPINQPMLLSMSYKNLSKIHGKVYQLSKSEFDKIANLRYKREDLAKYFNRLEAIHQFSQELPDEGDFQSHRLELKIPGQEAGLYMVLLSDKEDFSYEKNGMAYAFINVSNLSYVQRQQKGSYEYYLMDRVSGKPLAGVKAEFYINKYNSLLRRYENRKVGEAMTDDNGFVSSDKIYRKDYYNFYVKFSKGEDELYLGNSFYNSRYYEPQTYTRNTAHLFLDRAIYRPGQTVYYKGIVIQTTNGKDPKIMPNFQTEIIFYDANSQEVAKTKVTTNEFGSYQGTFTAPSSGLLGNMRIRDLNANATKYFRVEEYKRPKFEVNFLPVKESYQLDQEVTVKGEAKAYAGSNIDGAKVQYRVVRKVEFPYWRYWYWGWNPYSREEQEIAYGETKTDENGEYEIKFNAIPDKSIPKKNKPQFNYTIYADVTDITGETHSSQTNVNVGYIGLSASISVPERLLKEEAKELNIITKNLNGEFEAAKGKIKIEQLEIPTVVYNSRKWGAPDYFVLKEADFKKDFPQYPYKKENLAQSWKTVKTVLDVNFDSEKSKKLALKGIENWATGAYKVSMTTKDRFGNAIEIEEYFQIYSNKEDVVKMNEALFLADSRLSGEPGETVTLDFGSFNKEAHILFQVEHDGEIVRQEWMQPKGRKKIDLKIEEKHRGNFQFQILSIQNNRPYLNSGSVTVPWTNKELKIEYATFRDKLQPGQEEEWQIKISGPKKDKVAAEVLAGMYDASLDEFASNYWGLSLYGSTYGRLNWQASHGFGQENSASVVDTDWSPRKGGGRSRQFATLNWFGFSFYDWGYDRFYAVRGAANYAIADETEAMMEDADGVADVKDLAPPPPPPAPKAAEELQKNGVRDISTITATTAGVNQADKGDALNADAKPDFGDVKVRTNLNETVFFFPNLKTDAEGNVIIKFTMNEALTKWKFMLLAHTKDLKVGSGSKEVVTQKDLMVMPNAPRFFRQNDELYFTAKVSNMTEEVMNGDAVLQLFDAISMKPIDTDFQNSKANLKFSAKGKQSAPLVWKLQVPDDWTNPVTYRVIAKAGNFSDGEENSLPVLSNRMLVTETMPLPIRGSQTKTFEFKRMAELSKSNTMKHHKYTLEFTPNPAWYAIQSLPYLMEYPYECTEQIFSRYYANSLASEVANSHPKIKKVFDAWKNIQPEALESKLTKNEELKYALLEETPWVLNAQSEKQQKQNLGILFDLNRMGNELAQARDKMADRQLGNGGFSWFPGGRDSWYITQYIVEGMGHLDQLGVKDISKDSKISAMVRKANVYCDDRMAEMYQNLQAAAREAARRDKDMTYEKYMAMDHLGSMAIHYLYARSFFLGQKVNNKVTREAIEYYEGQAKKYWLNKSDYMQGMLALSLHRKGEDKTTPQDIVKSLKERALKSEEMGMYWKYPHGYYWYQLPIETHSLMIEVFDVVANDAQAVDDLKTYLLKAKQTTHWKTTKATASACYALLRRGDNWLMEDQEVKITLGSEVLDQSKIEKEAGTGYFKTSWDGDEIKNEMATVKVENPNKNVAWGAVYWQYFEQMDKITHFKDTPLKINKKLFLEVKTDRGLVLKPITATTKLQPGDKVKVRVELTVDRDMEYVHMKDQRASGFEPINVLSTYKYQGGLGYYESTRDASTNFFFSYLSKGAYVFEYPLRVTHKGDFSNGITTIQCMYAPEFTSHSEGVRVQVD
jgi:hypothetical protein